MADLPARGVLIVTDMRSEPLEASLGTLVQRYMEHTGWQGSTWWEVHLVLRPRPIEERTLLVTREAKRSVDFVVWTAPLAAEGQGLKAYLEREQGREPGSMSYGVITAVSPPFARRVVYRSDFYGVVCEPEGPAGDDDGLPRGLEGGVPLSV